MSLYLPIEVIESILTYLPARELCMASTICRSWNNSVTHLLYRSVDIYTPQQYNHFIKGLEECSRRITNKMDDNGYQVRRLFLHTSHIMLTDQEVDALKALCPMINEFDYAPHVALTDEHLCHFTPGWEQLTRLPNWHEDKHKDWIPKLGGQLTHAYCFIEELAFLPSFINTTPLFPSLVELKLALRYVGPPISLSWMEMLNDQCPVLESLDVEFVNYDLGGGLKADWKPAEKLHTLAWRIDALLDPIWYTYLSHKYPNVRQLVLHLGVDDYFSDFPSPHDQELNERMRISHKDCLFDMVTNFQQLSSFKILLESKQPSYLHWYPLSELATWLGTPAAKHITKLFWRTDPYHFGMADTQGYAFEQDGVDSQNTTTVAVDSLNPIGNIKVLNELAYDIHTQTAECLTNLYTGALVLENLTSLGLFFSRKYDDIETWEHLDINAILDGCPHLTTLKLAGVNAALEGVTPACQETRKEMDQQQQKRRKHSQHWKLTHFRLHYAIINDDDYLSNVLDRCPNVTKLKIYDCCVYQRRVLQRQNLQHIMSNDGNKRPCIKAFTINIPHHLLSLLDIRALRLTTFGDAYEGHLFRSLIVKQQNGHLTHVKSKRRSSDTDENNNYVVELVCRYADKMMFDLTAALYHDY